MQNLNIVLNGFQILSNLNNQNSIQDDKRIIY